MQSAVGPPFFLNKFVARHVFYTYFLSTCLNFHKKISRSSPELLNMIGIMLKGIFEIWGEGADHDEVEAEVNKFPLERKEPHLTESKSFKVIVDCFGHVLDMDQQLEHLKRLEYIPFKACG